MHLVWISALCGLCSAAWAQTNLPPVAPGVFNASARIEINAPIEKAWEALLDFPSYPNWNPFVRSQVVTDTNYNPLPDQTPKENLRLIIKVQIPPLTPPVNSSTPSNPLNSQTSLENITHVQHDLYRIAWAESDIPDIALSAQRWSALSVVPSSGGSGGNVTLYESREVYDGPLAYVVEATYGKGLQEGFDAQATAMKALLEGS